MRAWTKADAWEHIILALIKQDLVDETTLMLDGTAIKVHQHASGAIMAVEITNPNDRPSLDIKYSKGYEG